MLFFLFHENRFFRPKIHHTITPSTGQPSWVPPKGNHPARDRDPPVPSCNAWGSSPHHCRIGLPSLWGPRDVMVAFHRWHPSAYLHAQSGLSTDSAHRYASSWVRPVLITIVSGDEVPSSLFPSYFFRGRMVDDVPGFLPFQGRGHRHWIVSCDTIEEDTLRSCSWDAAQMPIAGALAPIESLTCQRPLPRVASRCPGLGRPSRFQDTFVLPPCSACSVPALTFALHGNRCLGLVHHFHSFPFFSALSRFPESVILCCVCCFLPPPPQGPAFSSLLGALLPFPRGELMILLTDALVH